MARFIFLSDIHAVPLATCKRQANSEHAKATILSYTLGFGPYS